MKASAAISAAGIPRAVNIDVKTSVAVNRLLMEDIVMFIMIYDSQINLRFARML